MKKTWPNNGRLSAHKTSNPSNNSALSEHNIDIKIYITLFIQISVGSRMLRASISTPRQLETEKKNEKDNRVVGLAIHG